MPDTKGVGGVGDCETGIRAGWLGGVGAAGGRWRGTAAKAADRHRRAGHPGVPLSARFLRPEARRPHRRRRRGMARRGVWASYGSATTGRNEGGKGMTSGIARFQVRQEPPTLTARDGSLPVRGVATVLPTGPRRVRPTIPHVRSPRTRHDAACARRWPSVGWSCQVRQEHPTLTARDGPSPGSRGRHRLADRTAPREPTIPHVRSPRTRHDAACARGWRSAGWSCQVRPHPLAE